MPTVFRKRGRPVDNSPREITVKLPRMRRDRRTSTTSASDSDLVSCSDSSVSGMTEDEISALKYRRMRDLNNEASKRCRENRKLRLGSAEADLRRQAERNLQLKAAVCALETRVARLKHVRNQIASSRRGLGPSLRISQDFIGSFAHSSVGDSHQHMRGPIPGLPKLTYHGPRPYH